MQTSTTAAWAMTGLLAALLGAIPARAQEAVEAPVQPGLWGVRLELATNSRAPVIREVESTLYLWALAEVGQDEQGWFQTHRVCEADIVGTSVLARTIIPQVYVEHMPRQRLRPQVSQEAWRWTWNVNLDPMPIGYDYDASPDVLPASADHPAVYDWDEDGKPGATVLVDLPLFQPFEVYITQLSRLRLAGGIDDENHIQGRLYLDSLERHVIGASNRLFNRDVDTWPRPDASRFFMLRLPQGTPCDQVRGLLEDS